MNYGIFRGDRYIKKITFSKAVLWYTRQLSLRKDIMDRIKKDGIKKMVFKDDLKGERWIFKPAKVFSHMSIKSVGQEEQCYFPIDICTKEKFTPKPEMIFDPERQVYVEIPRVVVTPKLSAKEEKQAKLNTQVSLFEGSL